MTITIFRPDWFNTMDHSNKEDRLKMNRYFIHQASLLASPALSIKELATALGVSEVMLTYPYSRQPDRGVISEKLAFRLQKLCGRDRMPVELTRPDLF